MSAAADGSSSYDPIELGRRIGFAFSAQELQRFADQLGVAAAVRWDRGHAEAARDVVRQFERSYGGIPTLVDRLRTAKPLVEWPEPGPPPSQAASQRPPPPGAAMASVPHPFGAAPVLASPGTLGGPPGPTIPGAPAFAPEPAPPVAAEVAPPSIGAGPASAGAEAIPPAPESMPLLAPAPRGFAPPGSSPAPWPGVVDAPAARPTTQGLDPRILIVVAGLMVVAAVIAYLAGRAGSSNQAQPAPSADASAAAPGARRPDGPATHLAAIVDRGVANVARACEVRNGPPEEVFTRSFEQCGPAPPQRVPKGARANLPAPAPIDREPAEKRDPRVRAPGGQPREAPGAACIKACANENTSCRSRCGPEPSEASKYGDYQSCMGRCITAASKCRLHCP